MERMAEEQIINIAQEIIDEKNIVALHGTSLECGISIMEEGLTGNRTTFVVAKPIMDPKAVASYGWKEASRGNAVNVIVSIPNTFFEQFLNLNREQSETFIKNIRRENQEDYLIYSISSAKTENVGLIISTSFVVPKQFIKGMFVYTDGKNYLDYMNKNDEAIKHLSFVSNPNYFENLSSIEQKKFVEMKKRELKEEKDDSIGTKKI